MPEGLKPLIACTGLSVDVGAHRILSDVDLSVGAAEIVSLVGPNGSGKSTLLRCLIGAQMPTSGRITRTEGLRLGYVPQKLFVDEILPMTVARFMGLPRPISGPAMREALATTGVDHLAQHQLRGLSGGQLQRVLLARALLHAPQLLILDEPTTGLDHRARTAFYDLVRELRDTQRCGILMVSHDAGAASGVSDRVICLSERILCEGPPDEVLHSDAYIALFGPAHSGATP